MDVKLMICDHKDQCSDSGCDHFYEHAENGDCSASCDEVEGGCQCVSIAEPLTPQQQVVKNTADRGYRGGWTAEQFAARQVCKLAEELGELAQGIHFGGYSGSQECLNKHAARMAIISAGEHAGWNFDLTDGWEKCDVGCVEYAQDELADIQVVVFNLAAVLAEITSEPFDVVRAAVDKSAADVERGVR